MMLRQFALVNDPSASSEHRRIQIDHEVFDSLRQVLEKQPDREWMRRLWHTPSQLRSSRHTRKMIHACVQAVLEIARTMAERQRAPHNGLMRCSLQAWNAPGCTRDTSVIQCISAARCDCVVVKLIRIVIISGSAHSCADTRLTTLCHVTAEQIAVARAAVLSVR
jgi:hypothetical protein